MAKDKQEEQDGPRLLTADERADAMKRAEERAAKAEYKPKTAQEMSQTDGAIPTDDAHRKALEAGVVHPQYINYEEAMENYEARDDIEPLAQRRAREVGSSFRDASFRRQINAVDNVGVTATDTATDKKPNATADEVEPENARNK